MRGLMLTVETDEGWDDGLITWWYVVKLNGREVYREETRYGAGDDDAEQWAAEKLARSFTPIK